MLKYESILLEKDDLTIDETLNPANFLEGEAGRRSPAHKCLDIIEYHTNVRPDLWEILSRPDSISLWVGPLR
jgi:hypothetical protein